MLRVCVRCALAALALFIPGNSFAYQLSITGAVTGNINPHSDAGTAPANLGPIRQEIDFTSSLPPGSVLVRTRERKLYFIEEQGRAIVWAVAVGRDGFAWSGRSAITRKSEWPDWRPPPEMIAREALQGHIIPNLVKAGPSNPLGAAAIYLGDSEYRIHGTDKPWSIGQAASSGCIRMLNESVTELYGLVRIGATVVVE